jgi:hypothetical protein
LLVSYVSSITFLSGYNLSLNKVSGTEDRSKAPTVYRGLIPQSAFFAALGLS